MGKTASQAVPSSERHAAGRITSASRSTVTAARTESDYGYDEDWTHVGFHPWEYSSTDNYLRAFDTASGDFVLNDVIIGEDVDMSTASGDIVPLANLTGDSILPVGSTNAMHRYGAYVIQANHRKKYVLKPRKKGGKPRVHRETIAKSFGAVTLSYPREYLQLQPSQRECRADPDACPGLQLMRRTSTITKGKPLGKAATSVRIWPPPAASTCTPG